MVTLIKYIIAAITLFFLLLFSLSILLDSVSAVTLSVAIPAMVICTGIIVYHIEKGKDDRQ